MHIVTGLFSKEKDVEKTVRDLNRHGFEGQDTVRVIDWPKVSEEEAPDAPEKRLAYTLTELGLPPGKVRATIEKLKAEGTLIAVRAEAENVAEVTNIMQEGNGVELASEKPEWQK